MRRRLINLTRLGDLLQTQPVLHALARQGDECGLACLENFAGAASLLQDVSHIAVLPGGALLAALDKDWRQAATLVTDWVERERKSFDASATLNLTPTTSARLLSRLLQPDPLPDGFSLDADGFGRNGSVWGVYTLAVTSCRGCSPFNLVDSFRQMAGVGHIPPRFDLRPPARERAETARHALEQAAEAEGLDHRAGFSAFQLGASNDARRWPAESFAAAGRRLLKESGVIPVLVGSAAERPLAEAYRRAGGPGVDFCGRTDLPQLAAVLSACRLLISNDTGTMHLAAGLGVPVLALFLATAQPWDTGPYRENMCCLEPRLDCHPCGFGTSCPHNGQCRHVITPRTVAGLALAWLLHGQWPQRVDSDTARVWLTTRDDRLFLDLRSLSGDEHADRTAWIRLQRFFYRRLLDGLENSDPAEGAERPWEHPANSAARAEMAPHLSAERCERLRRTLHDADGLLLLAGEQGRLAAGAGPSRVRRQFLATCERITALLQSSPDFVPLSLVWRTMLQEYADDWKKLLNFFAALRRELAELRALTE